MSFQVHMRSAQILLKRVIEKVKGCSHNLVKKKHLNFIQPSFMPSTPKVQILHW